MSVNSFIPPSDGIEIEENNEVLYAVARLADKFVNDVTKRYIEPITSNIDNLRKHLEIKSIEHDRRPEDYISILAVDSTWTKPFLELVLGDIAIIVTGYVVVAPAGMGSHGIAYIGFRRGGLDDESRFSVDVELDARIAEFYTATKRIDGSVDLVMLDGALYFSTTPEFFNPLDVPNVMDAKARTSGSSLAALASASLIKLLRKAQSAGIPVVGVVKRVASRFLLPIAAGEGLKDVESVLARTNDKLLLSLALKPGEYLVLDNYLETLRRYLSYVVKALPSRRAYRAKMVLEALESCRHAENGLLKELCNYMENTSIVFYKHVGDAVYPQAVRLDVYPRSAVESVVRYAIHNTSQNSVPIPIDSVDRYVRLESTLIKKIYGILKAHVRTAEVLTAISPSNPQKYYLFEQTERISG